METVTCPYCDKNTEIDTDEHYENYEEYECEHCGKNFEVFAEPTIDYSVCDKADCLNGADHKWRQIIGQPEIHFRGKYRCEDCSAEYVNEKEATTEEEWTEYWNEQRT